MRLRRSSLAFGSALVLMAGAADASLTLSAPENFGATGLGSGNTILTLGNPPYVSYESGQVSLSDGAQVISSSYVLTGPSQTQIQSFADLSVTSGIQPEGRVQGH